MKLLLILLYIINVDLFAQETVKKLDLNKDGITDRIEYFRNTKLIKRLEDRNNDGQIDYKIEYHKDGFLSISEQDADFDGIFERKTSEKFQDIEFTHIKYKVDQNQDKEFELTYYQLTPRDQKNKSSCYEVESVIHRHTLSLLTDFSDESIKIAMKADPRFIDTDFGYIIDKKCFDTWGAQFPNYLKDSINTGVQCLMNLHKNSNEKNITGALRNSHDLLSMLKDKKSTFVCSQQNYSWIGTDAHASADDTYKIEELNVSHPYISLNPRHSKDFQELSRTEDKKEALFKLKSLVFHESFHNLGYKHGSSIEYAYACADCCFQRKNMGKNLKDFSCRICTGDYKNELDIKYLEDLVLYSNSISYGRQAFEPLIKYMKENPRNLFGLALFARTLSNVSNPVGSMIIERMKKENKNLPANIKEHNYKAGLFVPQKVTESGRIIADAIYEIYYNKDIMKGIKLLDNNKAVLKKELEELNKDPSTEFLSENTMNVLLDVLRDLWINEYAAETEDLKASQTSARIYNYLKKS